MAAITFKYADLKGFGLDADILLKELPRLGIDVDDSTDEDITVDISPNRPDLLDFTGFVRAILNFIGKREPKENAYKINKDPLIEIRTTPAVKEARPFIAGIVAKNVNLTGNNLLYFINFTEKLCDTYGRKRKKFAIGLHNLDVISSPLVYDAARDKEFIPLGMNKKMRFEEIIAKHAKGIEYAYTLKDSKSSKYPYLVDAKNNIMSMIPIINSEFTRVTEQTKNLFVDITGISKTGMDQACRLLACSLIDMGAEVYPCIVSYAAKKETTPILDYKDVKVKITEIQRTLGVPVDQDRMIELANRLGHVAAKYGNSLLVRVAPYRVDVLNEQDVIEDIAIAYGYDRIDPLPVLGAFQGTPDDAVEYANKLGRTMVGLGFTEAMNTYLTNEKVNFENMMRPEDADSTVKVSYSKTENMTMLRTNILHELLQNMSESRSERMPLRLFEIGSVFSVKGGKAIEGRSMAFVSEHSRANFSEIKALTESALKHMRIDSYTVEDAHDSAFIEGRCAAVKVKGRVIGHFGELHPKVLESFGLEEPTVAAELEL